MLCSSGYETGALARCLLNGKAYYRLPDARHVPLDVAPEGFLTASRDGTVTIALDQIPYPALEILNQLVAFAVDHGQLKAVPSIDKLLDAPETVQEHDIVQYLKAHSPAFRAALKKFEANWGKLILHDNLLVARVTDLSLRVKLQKAFSASEENEASGVVFLPGEYIAFPRAMLGEIEKLVKKAGHIVKTVNAK